MKLLDGSKISEKILNDIKEEIIKIKAKINLAIIQVGNLEESNTYIEKKIIVAKELGIGVDLIKFNEDVKQEEIIKKILELNDDNKIHGILIQLPLTKNLDENMIFQTISPLKDIDGFTPLNKGLLEIKSSEIISPTAYGVYSLLNNYNIKIKGQNVVVIGKGMISGKPLATLLSNHGATVTMCDEFTRDLNIFTKNADIIVSSVGKPGLITNKMIKKNSTLISIGIKKKNGILYGDYDLDNISKKALYASPTPGGTGPMTVAYLFLNLLKCYKITNFFQ